MLKSCGACCFIFSIFAISFLLILSAVLASDSDIIEIPADERSAAASNCQLAAAIYGVFTILSGLCYVVGRWQERRRSEWSGEKERLKGGNAVYHQV